MITLEFESEDDSAAVFGNGDAVDMAAAEVSPKDVEKKIEVEVTSAPPLAAGLSTIVDVINSIAGAKVFLVESVLPLVWDFELVWLSVVLSGPFVLLGSLFDVGNDFSLLEVCCVLWELDDDISVLEVCCVLWKVDDDISAVEVCFGNGIPGQPPEPQGFIEQQPWKPFELQE